MPIIIDYRRDIYDFFGFHNAPVSKEFIINAVPFFVIDIGQHMMSEQFDRAKSAGPICCKLSQILGSGKRNNFLTSLMNYLSVNIYIPELAVDNVCIIRN